jgi:uncharacterized RDD family membrane protein YckC/cytoskeletal protein CcmA (bactofilin family)
MKMSRSPNPFVLLLLALALALGPSLRAEETPSTPPPEKKTDETKPAETAPPADDKKLETPAPAADDKVGEATGKVEQKAEELADKITDKVDEKSSPAEKKKSKRNWTYASEARHRHNDGPPFGDHTIASGSVAAEAVSVFGHTTVDGVVENDAVAVFGNNTINGSVGGESVSVFGNTHINGPVNGEGVAVFGDVELGPKAVIGGDITVVFGQLTRDPAAQTHGAINNVGGAGYFGDFVWLRTYITKCVLWGRLLWIGPNLGWAWIVDACFLLFYALLALLFPRGIERSVETLEQRPGGTVLAAFLAMLLTPFLIVLLAITGIGVALIPFVGLALFVGTLFGKASVHAWLGRRLAKLFGGATPPAPVAAVLIGGVFLSLLYMVPIFGMLLWKLFGALGLGMVVYRLVLLSQREKPAVVSAAAGAGVAGMPPASTASEPSAIPVPPMALAPISAVTLPRAGFWIRIAAALLDAVLVGIVIGMLGSMWHGFGHAYPLWYALYCVGMWASKGTTIGGIICGLKIVRLDDRPVDWSVAIVRALGGFLSLCVAGLGFIWVAFDHDKQSWHDKIAGTTIVRVPKGTPLL